MHTLSLIVIFITLVIATSIDLWTRRIPNWLVGPFLVLGIASSSLQAGWRGFGQSCMGMGLGLLIYGVLFALKGMGAGDVKLCAAIGAWIGPHQLLIAIVLISLIGGVMALCWSLARGLLRDTLDAAGSILAFWRKRSDPAATESVQASLSARMMPYSPAIALGTVLSFLAVPR